MNKSDATSQAVETTESNTPAIEKTEKKADKKVAKKAAKPAKKKEKPAPAKKTAKPAKKAPAKKAVKKKSGERHVDNSKRNFNRIRFQGKDYPKGRVVLVLVQELVKKNPKITLSQLTEKLHADTLVKPWGLVAKLSEAKRANGKKKRYFDNEGDVIVLKDTKIAVTNQISSKNIAPVLEAFKKHGFKTTAAPTKR